MVQNSSYNIVYAADDNFAPFMGVSILSLFENNRSAEHITLTILDSNISIENKKKVERLCEKYHRCLPNWIRSTDIEEKLGIRVNTDRGSISQYSRIFLSEVFSTDVEKVLYLDCDTLIVDNIIKLWNMDLEDNVIGAFKDAFSKYYRKNIGLDENSIMFNSGVMLIDLNKWRELKIEDKLLNTIDRYDGKIQQGDQGALNAVLSKKTKILDPKYNMVSILYELTYRELKLYRNPHIFYSKSEINNAKKNPVIIHYTSSFMTERPWESNCTHPLKNLWIDYKEKSEWRTSKFVSKNKKYTGIVKLLPRKVLLILASSFQIYGRPIFYKLRR